MRVHSLVLRVLIIRDGTIIRLTADIKNRRSHQHCRAFLNAIPAERRHWGPALDVCPL